MTLWSFRSKLARVIVEIVRRVIVPPGDGLKFALKGHVTDNAYKLSLPHFWKNDESPLLQRHTHVSI